MGAPAVAAFVAFATASAIGVRRRPASRTAFSARHRTARVVDITAGDIDCVTASDFAAQYDLNGDKYQQIGPFTCYSGNAMTAPLLFQCVADTEDQAEFGVYPA